MERLTAVQNGATVYVGPCCGYDTGMISSELQPWHIRQVLNRLAAYEKTGLEPEEVYILCRMDRRAKIADLLRLEAYQELGSIEELAALKKNGAVMPVADETKPFAEEQWFTVTRWNVEDAIAAADEQGVSLAPEQAAAWWKRNESRFQDMLVEYGNEILRNMNFKEVVEGS